MGESESGKRPPHPRRLALPTELRVDRHHGSSAAACRGQRLPRARHSGGSGRRGCRPLPAALALLHESCALSKQQTYTGVSTERDLARPSSAPAKPTRPPQTPLQKKPLLLWSPGPALAQSEGDVLALGTPTWKGLGRPSLTAPFPGFSCAFL